VLQKARDKFRSTFAAAPAGAVRAPGRVNLIGEHTDYNGGFVLPIAIERYTYACWRPRRDRTINIVSDQADEAVCIRLDEPIRPGRPQWANYCRGVVAGLIEEGIQLNGADVALVSDVPIGAGLSSSASLEVATALALLAAAGAPDGVEASKIALLCQEAEHRFAGAPCGIMDQTIAIRAQRGCALLLDCLNNQAQHVPVDESAAVVLVVDTQVKHDLAAGEYARRRQQCAEAAERLGVSTLRQADERTLAQAHQAGRLDETLLMRARHVVGEIARTLRAAEALREGQYELFGRLMYESHASLRDDFEVSCEQLDAIIDKARTLDGVYGARMTGGGFGGSAIILVRPGSAEAIGQALQDSFADRFGYKCPVFATRAAAGAGPVA